MIEKLKRPVKIGGTTFREKINEIVDAVNELQENQNTYWTDIAELKKELQTRSENVQPDAESRSENVQNELERTRKALEIAVDALGYYASENSWDETNRWMFVEMGFEFAKDVLEQITTLEQKE